MSLIYGYSESEGSGSEDGANLKCLVGSTTDNTADDTAFGRIQKNRKILLARWQAWWQAHQK